MSSATACNATHGMAPLSFFTASVSVTLFTTTIPVNVLVLTALLRKRRNLYNKAMFYRILMNIAIADLLTGFVSDGISIFFHIKEGLGDDLLGFQVISLHCSLFLINGSSVLTMSLLCIDRILALLKPYRYQRGLKPNTCVFILASTWIVAGLLIVPYFLIGYIKYLNVFSFATVTITSIGLLALSCISKKYLVAFENKHATSKAKQSGHEMSQDSPAKTNERYQSRKKALTKANRMSTEKQVNKSFGIMLVVFLITYLPACFMTVYMNLCSECDCVLVHVMRELTYIFILSSALFRPLNFIWRVKTLKKSIRTIIRQCFKL